MSIQKISDIKTIDVNAKEWFDKVNGNSYFSCRVTLNYGMENETTILIPFQYGYGNMYEQATAKELVKRGLFPANTPLWRVCGDNSITRRTNILTKCLKRDVLAWGK